MTCCLGYIPLREVKNGVLLSSLKFFPMKRILSICLSVVSFMTIMCLTGCATICGGAKYNAEIIVDNHPKAEITYNGRYIGSGRADIKIRRRDADKVVFTVKEEGKKEQYYSFHEKTFRGWSLLGTILGWTGYYQGIYLPWGVAVDGITGSWWKPCEYENGVVKVDYDNYRYFLKYNAQDDESQKPSDNTQNKAVGPEDSIEIKLKQIDTLKEKGLISDAEYNRMRESILND